jgi:hypothetical protein
MMKKNITSTIAELVNCKVFIGGKASVKDTAAVTWHGFSVNKYH